MSGDERPYVFAAVQVLGITLIDGGRTLAVRLQRADGEETVVLLAYPLAEDLNWQLADTLNRAPETA